MRRMDFSGFNKEKLIFLICTLIFAITLYLFLAASPIELPEMKPIGALLSPSALPTPNAGTMPEDSSWASAKRKTPFAPVSAMSTIVRKDPKVTPPTQKQLADFNPPPPPSTSEIKKPETTKKSWTAQELDIQLDYVGVLSWKGETQGLVKSKDGETRSVKVGDKIPDLNYEVTAIYRTEIWMKDDQGRPFILQNAHAAGSGSGDEVASADDTPKATPDKTAKKKNDDTAKKLADDVAKKTADTAAKKAAEDAKKTEAAKKSIEDVKKAAADARKAANDAKKAAHDAKNPKSGTPPTH